MADTFTCAHCKRKFLKAWSDAEAQASYEATMPNSVARGDDTTLVCGDCYELILQWAKEKGLEP